MSIITKIAFIDLSVLLDKTDLKESEIPEKLLVIINKFNEYLDNININNDGNIINFFLKLMLKKYNDAKENDEEYNDTLISTIIGAINKNISSIIKYYNDINYEIISSNSMIQYYFAYLIFKSIIILYTYNFYLINILKFINENEYENKNFNFFLIFILKNIHIDYYFIGLNTNNIKKKQKQIINEEEYNEEEYNELNELLNEQEKIDKKIKELEKLKEIIDINLIEILSIIYKFICIKFNEEIINIYSNKISYNSIKNNIDQIKINKIKYESDDEQNFQYNICNLIIQIFLISDRISQENKNYITIPQYEGVCWYISMLTCMCYSDASKKLILSKIESIKVKKLDIPQSEKELINIVDYIITNITNNHKKYNSSNIKSDCEFFLFFKNNLLSFLLNKLKEIKENFSEKPIIRKYIGNDDFYFIDIIKNLLENNYELSNPIIYSILAISKYGYLILNTLYKIFDILTVFIYNINIDNSKYIQKDKLSISNPDIIFIQDIPSNDSYLSNNIKQSSNLQQLNDSIIQHENNDIIYYNEKKYKYEFILHMTNNNDTCNASGCGHCISGIHYNGEQYYYDSKYSEQNIQCNDDNIKIPCSLIKQKWNNSSDKNYFTINKCFLRNADISKDALKIEKEHISDEQMFFSKNTSLIRAYIKVDASDETTSGGNNNKYKFTHKKINILNKNNKIIERIIYINDIKTKFIKYNKTFKPLSDFKFNKKNKYYYI